MFFKKIFKKKKQKQGPLNTKEEKKPITEMAEACIRGEYGSGAVRMAKLKKLGFDYYEVQEEVKRILSEKE